jgi:hypothetical protein
LEAVGAFMANLDEQDLEAELLRIYEEGGKFGYWAKRFYQMFTPHCERYVGGVAAEFRYELSCAEVFLSSKINEIEIPKNQKKETRTRSRPLRPLTRSC